MATEKREGTADGRSPRRVQRGGPPRRSGQGTGGGDAPAARRAAGGKRHQGRVLALQLLYELDIAGHTVDEVLARTLEEQPVPSAMRSHVERLVRGVLDRREELDPYIAAAAPAFPVAQLPAIDRNVLRLAVFELLHESAVPPRAAINEAVELAKEFGGPNSGRFVNGVLGTIAERLRRVEPSSDTAGEAAP